ncbi:tegument protein G45 [Wood mouse herpesvirus]|uniref:Tegument protein G45 n=1 Tax=Wood mouse herpesvirus TaxID=432370 RepID=D0U1N4_9GAMA|nr:tegument protein G45 [Wood mouse herpesvirus]ACY41116.1 tegument protein G45 [Wood mouse herpesvirus]
MDAFKKPVRMLPIKGAPISRPVTVFTFDLFQHPEESDGSSTPDSVFEEETSPARTPATPALILPYDYESSEDSDDEGPEHADGMTPNDQVSESSTSEDSDSDSDSSCGDTQQTFLDDESTSSSGEEDNDELFESKPQGEQDRSPSDSEDDLPAILRAARDKQRSSSSDSAGNSHKKRRVSEEDSSRILKTPAPISGNGRYNWPWLD